MACGWSCKTRVNIWAFGEINLVSAGPSPTCVRFCQRFREQQRLHTSSPWSSFTTLHLRFPGQSLAVQCSLSLAHLSGSSGSGMKIRDASDRARVVEFLERLSKLPFRALAAVRRVHWRNARNRRVERQKRKLADHSLEHLFYEAAVVQTYMIDTMLSVRSSCTQNIFPKEFSNTVH